MRSKADEGASDETETVKTGREVAQNVNAVIRFITFILSQRDKLASAITAAKRSAPIDIDAACSLNKARQKVARELLRVSRIKSSERRYEASGYRFNAEGNQTTYYYPVVEVKTTNFDRGNLRQIIDNIIAKSDSISDAIDKALADTPVDYSPPFSASMTWDEALAVYEQRTNSSK